MREPEGHPTLFAAPVPRETQVKRARAKRDRAVERVEANADELWKAEAWSFMLRFCEEHAEVFCDDLWDAGLPRPREARAIGPLMMRARKAGLIAPTGQSRPSVRSHLSSKPVWRSLVYRGREEGVA